METTPANIVENFISNWNEEFPNYPLTKADLKKPQAVMGALFQVFDRLGIDRDAVIMPPPEESRTVNMMYYRDLIPVINMTRVTNHLLSVIPQVDATISITHFLQPTVATSQPILLLLFNLMVFKGERLRYIAPYEEELFSKTEQVKILEDRKNHLIEMLNAQAIEKGKRAGRLQKLDQDIQQLEEEFKQEIEAPDEDKQELEAILKENRQAEILLEQKKTQRDTLMSEIEKMQSLRVYDAEDIKAQAEQAAQNVQDAEEKLNSLTATLTEKKNSLKNLQTIKSNLDSANNLLHKIMKLSESLRDYENGDLDSDSEEGELDVLKTEVSELEVQLAELRVAIEDANKKIQESHAKRQQKRTLTQRNLREAEEEDRKCSEVLKKAVQRLKEIKELTSKYEQQKIKGMEELTDIKEHFTINLKSTEEALLKKALEAKEKIEEKLRQI